MTVLYYLLNTYYCSYTLFRSSLRADFNIGDMSSNRRSNLIQRWMPTVEVYVRVRLLRREIYKVYVMKSARNDSAFVIALLRLDFI